MQSSNIMCLMGFILSIGCLTQTSAFVPQTPTTSASWNLAGASSNENNMETTQQNEKKGGYEVTKAMPQTRQAFLASIITSSAASIAVLNLDVPNANAEEESFASIAARAASMAENADLEEEEKKVALAMNADPRTAYDFSLPMRGEPVSLMELIGQEFDDVKTESQGSVKREVKVEVADGETAPEPKFETVTETVVDVKRNAKVKAILVVNMKQDDPIARKNIPELISLASK